MATQDSTKRCPACNRTLPLDQFSRDRTKSNGHRSWCKECTRPKARKTAKYPSAQYQRDWRRLHPGALAKSVAKWHLKNPGKLSAYRAVCNAVRRGDLPVVSTLLCSCGQPARHYHHHLGYEPQHRLSVAPLCGKCHKVKHHKK
jgi:hypothetical protein